MRLSCSHSCFQQAGGVISSDGDVIISGGMFYENVILEWGGVWHVGSEGNFSVRGGVFKSNRAHNGGGVGLVFTGGTAVISGGVFSENIGDRGGVFQVRTGANFTVNHAPATRNDAA